MNAPLPDITGIESLSTNCLHELGLSLHTAGFNASYLNALWQMQPQRYNKLLSLSLAIWHARSVGDRASIAARVFALHDPVGLNDVSAVLGVNLMHQLIDAGMLAEIAPGSVVSRFDLRLFRGLLILCDKLSYQGEAVFGVGSGTTAFHGFAGRQNVRRALDLGCGAGAVALALARHAEHVVATDINPRAIVFLRCNAALNGIDNIEGRVGDLFDSTFGETFDIITSQPPYVPAGPDFAPATYLYGGPTGNEILTRLLDSLPEHLEKSGRAIIVFEQALRDGNELFGALKVLNGRMRALLIYGDEVDAATFSIRHALPLLRTSVEDFDHAVIAMWQHLRSIGISAFYSAICVVEHAVGAAAYVDGVRASDSLWSGVSDDVIERLLEGSRLLGSIEELKQASLAVPDGSLVIRRWSDEKQANATTYLSLPPEYPLPALELSAREWAEVERSASNPGGAALSITLLEKAARAGLIQ